jgi:calcineurin-like phosphoesterase family protein
MSNVYFISDLHLGHKNIMKFAGSHREGVDSEDHDRILFENWHSRVNKRDLVFVLGDVAFNEDKLTWFSTWSGRKQLVRGNHDEFDKQLYYSVFEQVYGIISYKGFWLSHCPIHPCEIRNRKANIHGHVHQNSVLLDNGELDVRYWNSCVEAVQGVPRTLIELEERYAI